MVGDNVEPCVMKTQDAINLALEMELDLVEISPKAEPPVCRITEYKKFLYDQKKKQKEIKAKHRKGKSAERQSQAACPRNARATPLEKRNPSKLNNLP